MRWRLCGLTLAALAALAAAREARAQAYRFHVERMDLQVYVQPDAGARLEYEIVFANQPGAHPIDVVDVGLPHSGYQLGTMSASCDGTPLSGIRKSSYIAVGVEVPLGARTILPGRKGTFRFTGTMPKMIYQDTTDPARAALQIKATWFDPTLQAGPTQLRMAVHLLPGIKGEEVKYHSAALRYKTLVQDAQDGHVVAVWEFPNQFLSAANPKIGISFPQRGLDHVVRMSAVELLVKWFAERPGLRRIWGGVLVILFLVTFFRFSHGTGWILGLGLTGGLIVLMVWGPGWQLLCGPVVVGLLALNEWFLQRRRRSYLPPMATVEGGGIKRGLTAPQAAVLLEVPLKRVLALVIFGLLKKGFLRIVQDRPLQVEVVPDYCCPRRERQQHAAKAGTTIHTYEQSFLDRLQAWNKPVEACDLNEPLRTLITSTAERMQGFDLSDTQEYYRRIVARAWQAAEAIGEIEQRTKVVDRNLEWMMMDGDWGGRFETWGRGGYHYWPRWGYAGSSGGGVPTGRGATPAPQTSLGEVAASFAGWAENTTGRLAAAIEPGSLNLGGAQGLVNLQTVDTVTTDVFKAIAESVAQGGSGSGGGGGCACACAGCACACACAGGGR